MATPSTYAATGSARERTAAVLTAYRPGPEIRDVVAAALGQTHQVIVVDNTPADEEGAETHLIADPRLTVLRSGANVGLAAALNHGVAAVDSAELVFFLDQDSSIAPSIVNDLAAHLGPSDPRRAIAAPAPWDASAERYLDPRSTARAVLAEMSVVITSGMLVRRSALDTTRGFREDFFVDCVDQDFCLQLRSRGWSIVQDRQILLPHTLGQSRWHGVGKARVRATHHPTWRLYWVGRNGIILTLENLRTQPRWALTNLAILAYWGATILAFEPPRLRRWATLVRGIWDGLRRRRSSRDLPPGAR